jgi:lipopolysaccharide transport system permease protein
MINEGCITFIDASGIILQVRLPLFTHIFRIAWRNLIVLAHNADILPIVLVATQIAPKPIWLMALPGLVLVNVNWISLVLAIPSARFRDITQAVHTQAISH